ncbi:MAG TPA: DinB family protein [Vicinamibacterales bacterium]|nr:DinB family protein [Vicinamibacterales bacterium]
MNVLFVAALLAVAVPAAAQTRSTSIVQDLRDREFATIRGDMVAAGELMPEGDYAFKPVATVRSFGEEIAHATAVNRRLCGMASGATAPPAQPPAPAVGKGALMTALRDSFERCAAVLAAATDESVLTPTVGPYIRASHLTAMVAHNTEVYGKLALMLRMKDLVPPSTARQTK